MRIINIAGKSYYAGLSWQTLSTADNIKEKIKEFKSGYYCVRNLAGMINIGHSEDLDDGKYKKLYSLASNVANVKKEPWLGVFRIEDNLYWLIAVRDNQAIIPDGDVLGTKEEIDKIFAETISIGDWDSIIEEGTLEDLKSLLTSNGNYVLSVNKKFNTVFIFIIGLLISAFILYLYHRHITQIKPKVFVPKIFVKKTVVKIPQYKLMPKPNLVLYKCEKELNSLPGSFYGWKAVSLSCAANNILVTYKKQSFGTTLIMPKGSISQNGLEVSKNISFSLPVPVKFRKLLNQNDVLKLIYGYMQEFNINGSVTNAGDKFMVTLNLNSLKMIPVFFTIPTFRIESIKITGLPLSERINVVAEVWHD